MSSMKLPRALGLSCILAGASSASAAPIKLELEVGGEYHFQTIYTDDGLYSEDAANIQARPKKEFDFVTKGAKFSLRGKINDQISWTVLYKADVSQLERYFLTNKVNDDLSVTVGQQKIKVYGFHRKWTGVTLPVTSSILRSNPLTDKLAIDVTYKLAGTLSLQLVKDYFDAASTCTRAGTGCTSWNASDQQKQPAIVVEWIGDFNGIQPLIQYASYDKNHSNTASLGLRYKSDVVDTFLDFTQDTRNNRGVGSVPGKFEDQETKYTGVTLYGEYFTGTWTPYWHLSTFNVDQFTAPGASQPETNSDGRTDDNEQLVSLGTHYDGWGSFYRPYVGVARTQGKYVDPQAPADKETRSKTDILAGLIGKF